MFGDTLYLDSDFWEQHNLVVHPWKTLDTLTVVQQSTRVMVTIRDFPLDFWHPVYFRQATVNMGSMLGMADETMVGGRQYISYLPAMTSA